MQLYQHLIDRMYLFWLLDTRDQRFYFVLYCLSVYCVCVCEWIRKQKTENNWPNSIGSAIFALAIVHHVSHHRWCMYSVQYLAIQHCVHCTYYHSMCIFECEQETCLSLSRNSAEARNMEWGKRIMQIQWLMSFQMVLRNIFPVMKRAQEPNENKLKPFNKKFDILTNHWLWVVVSISFDVMNCNIPIFWTFSERHLIFRKLTIVILT